jgi:hypothetical protein
MGKYVQSKKNFPNLRRVASLHVCCYNSAELVVACWEMLKDLLDVVAFCIFWESGLDVFLKLEFYWILEIVDKSVKMRSRSMMIRPPRQKTLFGRPRQTFDPNYTEKSVWTSLNQETRNTRPPVSNLIMWQFKKQNVPPKLFFLTLFWEFVMFFQLSPSFHYSTAKQMY